MSVEFRKKFKRKKILSFASAAVVAFTMTAAPVFAATDSGNTKDETVYVVTESDGSQSDLIVSDHLKNKSGKDKIEDISTLTDIENVKGKEKFKREDDGTLSWYAKGNDIYYQGKTDQEAPISMDIKYYLDGKEVEGADLSGKTGKVKIVINYTNNAEYQGIKVPFVVLTGMVLENDTFQNVTVSSGKVIDDGQKSFIVGMAAPGIADNLGISEDELGFGSTVEITGDAKKFAPEDMMTVVTNDFFQDIDMSELGVGDLDSQIGQLDNAAKQLVSGTNTLYKGIETLNSSSAALASGVGKLNQGAAKIDENTKAALQGSKDLAAGVGLLKSKYPRMEQGSQQLAAGSASLEAGINQLVKIMETGDTITVGEGQKMQVPSLVNTCKALATEISQLNGMASLDSLTTLDNTKLEAAKNALEAEKDKISPDDYNAIKAVLDQQTDNNATIASNNTKITADNKEIDKYNKSLPTIKQEMAGVSGGVSVVYSGLKSAATGAKALADGSDELKEGINSSQKETLDLKTGMAMLDEGTTSLVAGETKLSAGASELAAGMNELYSKSGLLISGIGQLDAGSKKLNDGMSQFYKEGIGKIVSLYNDKLKGTVNNAGEMVAVGKAYNTFTQVPDGMDGTVKFIYRTKVAD